MSRARRPNFIPFGPEIPIVPVGDFSKLGLTAEQWDDAWRIIGPSVDRNMSGRRSLPLWKIIAAAYLEGLHHGSSLAEGGNDGRSEDSP